MRAVVSVQHKCVRGRRLHTVRPNKGDPTASPGS